MTESTRIVADQKQKRRKLPLFWRCLYACLAVVSIALLVWSVGIEPNQLITNEANVSPPNWPKELDGMRVVLISDLHFGSHYIDEQKVRKVVETANASRPDLILLLGDYVCTIGGRVAVTPDVFAGWLSPLKARLGVFAVLGNHDWWYDGNKVRTCVEGAGIKVLENETVTVRSNSKALAIVGLADSWTRKPRLFQSLWQIPAGDPILLLTHNPDVFPTVPARVSLTVAGHTHGGQVSIPFIGPLIVPSEYGARYARGLINEGGRELFVSSGIGTSVFPIRFLVPPEIVVLTLRSGNKHL